MTTYGLRCMCVRIYVLCMVLVCIRVSFYPSSNTQYICVVYFFFVEFRFSSPSLSLNSFQFSSVLSFHFYWACQLYVNHRQRRTHNKNIRYIYPIARAEDTFLQYYNTHKIRIQHVFHCF